MVDKRQGMALLRFSMGVESGGDGGTGPPVEQSAGDVPQNRGYFSIFFDTYKKFSLSSIFKIKWLKSEEKLNFGGRLGWVPMNQSPPPPKQNFVATPLRFSLVKYCHMAAIVLNATIIFLTQRSVNIFRRNWPRIDGNKFQEGSFIIFVPKLFVRYKLK